MDRPSLRILSVNAHPHDFTHTAGTLGVHTSEGDTATVVSVTSGVKTHNEALHDELMKPVEEQDPAIVNQTEGELAEIKAAELREACAIFGVTDVRILGFPQPFRHELYPEAVGMIRDVILDVRPHVLIMQSPYSSVHHGRSGVTADDHIETARATLEARGEAGQPQPGIRPHSIASTLFPGVYFQRDEYDFMVDVTDWFERRVQGEAAYVSQGHTPEWSRVRMQNTLGPTGWQGGTRYAESFVRESPELHSRIALSDRALAAADEAIGDRYRRMVGGSGQG